MMMMMTRRMVIKIVLMMTLMMMMMRIAFARQRSVAEEPGGDAAWSRSGELNTLGFSDDDYHDDDHYGYHCH